MDWFDWLVAVFITVLTGMLVVVGWMAIAEQHCDDGFVYFDNNNYRGCVPLDFAKENS